MIGRGRTVLGKMFNRRPACKISHYFTKSSLLHNNLQVCLHSFFRPFFNENIIVPPLLSLSFILHDFAHPLHWSNQNFVTDPFLQIELKLWSQHSSSINLLHLSCTVLLASLSFFIPNTMNLPYHFFSNFIAFPSTIHFSLFFLPPNYRPKYCPSSIYTSGHKTKL